MLELAELLGRQQGGLGGRPTELVEQALKVAPDYWKALALAGRAAFDREDFAAAVTHWEKLRTLVPGESTALAAIDEGLAQARARLGGAAPTADVTPPPGAPGAERVSGTVTLAPSLKEKVGADETVFIFARHAQGPRMPLAVLRKKVSDLPIEFSLDDSMAMSPALRLSAAASVVVTARVSKSGTVTPGPGDLQGESSPVAPGTGGLSIEIATKLP
jgi:cytochrome c-type biogenesis protein CcmH